MVAVFLALPYLFLSTFTIFWPFDDEGTLMITFQNLLEGARLYNDAYALYGPFYYFVIGPLFLILRLPLTNDVARGVTMAFWLIDAAVLAAVVFRLTRSIEALAFAFLAGLFLLAIFSHSALHPEEICILLIGWALHLFCRIDRRPDATTFAALGSIIAGLVLTKINAGAFVALPVLLIALKSLAPRRWSSALFALVAGAGALMPFALMDPLMRFDWVVNYMLFSTVTVAAAILAWWRAEIGAAVTVRQWTVALVAMCVTAAAVIAATMLRGASAYAILYTTVLQNPGHIQNWYTPMDFERRALAAAALSAVLMAGYLASRNRASERAMDLALAWVKLALSGLGMLYVAYVALRRTPWAAEPHMLFQVLMPFCWLFIVQPRSRPGENALTRGAVGLICAFFVLYPFPVNGSQTAIAVALPTLMLPLLLRDALLDLGAGRIVALIPRWLSAGLGPALAGLAFVGLLGAQTLGSFRTYASEVSLDLPGSRLLHVEPNDRANLHWVVDHIAGCENLFTMPGQFSLYFWSGKRTLSAINNNNLLGFLTPAQQQALVDRLKKAPDLCVVVNPSLLAFFDRGQIARKPILLEYLRENFTTVAANGGYEIQRPKFSAAGNDSAHP